MDYAVVKQIHLSAVLLSGLGFATRGWASLHDAAWVRGRSARTLPHVVDAALLVLGWIASVALLKNPWGVFALLV